MENQKRLSELAARQEEMMERFEEWWNDHGTVSAEKDIASRAFWAGVVSTPDKFAEIEQAYLNDTIQALQHQLKAANKRVERTEKERDAEQVRHIQWAARQAVHLYEIGLRCTVPGVWRNARAEDAEAKLKATIPTRKSPTEMVDSDFDNISNELSWSSGTSSDPLIQAALKAREKRLYEWFNAQLANFGLTLDEHEFDLYIRPIDLSHRAQFPSAQKART